jgi:hypothetical protein
MVRNVGTLDRGARIVFGILLLGLFGALPNPWKPFALLGLIFIATGITGACPLYGLIGISTRRVHPQERPTRPESDADPRAESTPPLPRSEDEATWPPKPAPPWRPWESKRRDATPTHGG